MIFGGHGNAIRVHVNGICNSKEEAFAKGLELQKELGGIEVHIIYNGSKGLMTDLIECGMQKLNIGVTPENTYVKHMNDLHKIHGTNQTYLVSAHSQGGLIVGNAIPKMSKDMRSQMHVRTIGSASMISNDYNLASVGNFVSKTDIVPLTDPWGYAKGLMGKSNVTYMNPQTWMIPDHFLEGKTYQKAADSIEEDFRKIIRNTK